MMQPSGHVDFYPNGGQKQPGCSLMDIENSFDITTVPDDNVDSLSRHLVACRHTRAIKLYIESVDSYEPGSCVYVGFECKSYDDFKQVTLHACTFYSFVNANFSWEIVFNILYNYKYS